MSRARLAKLAADIAARQHAVQRINDNPKRSASDLDTRMRLLAELRALERERDAEVRLAEWIAPKQTADMAAGGTE